jgi:DNA polymerase I-like protein with 3'-5' exonuclease and polymerase domains
LQLAALDRDPVVIDCWELEDHQWVDIEEFFAQKRYWLAHNAVFDLGWLQEHEIYPNGEVLCTMLASRILTNGQSNVKHGLQNVVKRYLKEDISKEEQKSDWSGDLTQGQLEYAAKDVQLLIQLDGPINQRMAEANLHRAWFLECKALPAMAQLWRTGLPFDRNGLEALQRELTLLHKQKGEEFLVALDQALPEDKKLPRFADGRINTNAKPIGTKRAGDRVEAGFNLNSPKQLLDVFTALLGNAPVTAEGKPSASKLVLREYVADHPVVADYLTWKRIEKRRQMVESLLKHLGVSGYIKASYMQLGADTGRMSCVSGDTVLITSRGDFTFEEYVPIEGDLVLTHIGRWMPVVRKLYRGVEPVFEVVTAEGGRICCTSDHKLWTGSRWTRISDLSVGDSLGLFKEVGSTAAKHRSCAERVSERTKTYGVPSSRHSRNELFKCGEDPAGKFVIGKTASRESIAVIERENRFVEPYEGQEWFPAPQLRGGSRGPQGLFDGAGRQRREGVPAQIGDGTCPGPREIAAGIACASHRREHTQQHAGQFGAGDGGWTQSYTPAETLVESIKPLGPVGVWDIEVEGDHSYALYGFLSHNCMSPNLQQIPRDSRFRECVKAPDGWRLVVADYAQMELRLAAAEAKDELMIRAFQQGTDLHTLTAMQIYGVSEDEVTKDQRQVSKSANFGLLYGSGAKGLRNYAAGMGIQMDITEAEEVRKKFHAAYKGISKWQRGNAQAANAAAEFAAVRIRHSGLRRILHGDNNSLTVRCNTPIQGAGAAVLKRTLGKLWPLLQAEGEDVVQLAGVVHDEIILLVREGEAERWATQLKATMEEAEAEWLDGVPPLADVNIGVTWEEAK